MTRMSTWGLKGCGVCFVLCHDDGDDDDILEVPWGLARPSGASAGRSTARGVGSYRAGLGAGLTHPLQVSCSDLDVQVSRTQAAGLKCTSTSLAQLRRPPLGPLGWQPAGRWARPLASCWRAPACPAGAPAPWQLRVGSAGSWGWLAILL